MLVSVITVSYNSEKYIIDCIESVNNQSYEKIEHIFIDGLSSDRTLDIIRKESKRIGLVLSESDNGIYDGMNKGLLRSSGDIIVFLNSDDFYIDEHVISKVVNYFQKYNIDSCYADLVYVDKDNVNNVKRTWRSKDYYEGAFLYGWMPPHPTFFVKKEIFSKYGMFNLDLGTAADYELMLRFIHKEKISIGYIQETIIKMRDGGQSNSSIINRIRANRFDVKAWEINNIKPFPWTLILKPLRKIFQYNYLVE
jgi:glycosyltransferase involved in cell wall biosynthesis